MKLSVDFSALWSNVKKMGATIVDFDLGVTWIEDDIEFDTQLSTSGIDIDLNDIVPKEDLLSHRGRQVLLFIPDHGFRVEATLAAPSGGNKFHISHCQTLEEMQANNRFGRYKVTNNVSGVFEIYGTSIIGQNRVEGEAKLNVCKLCLNKINFKNAANETVSGRNRIVKEFSLDEFFSSYSSLFRYYPTTNITDAENGYTEDWPTVSLRVRTDANYYCSHCNVCLKEQKNLLHVHHRNGEKSDNSSTNLIPLCADCHRKQPYHQHMHVKHADVQRINHFRRAQGLISNQDWRDVFKNADPSCHGVIAHCQKFGYSCPEVGYEILDDAGSVVANFELAWPNKKVAVVLHHTNTNPFLGWRVFSLNEAVEFFGRGARRSWQRKLS